MGAVIERMGGAQLSAEMAELAQRVRASVVEVRGSRSGAGSGVVWAEDGMVVTNHHVVPRETAEVVLAEGARLAARLERRDERLDLAALRVEGGLARAGVRAASVGDSARLRPGELVVAVGNPLGERNAVALGVVNGLGTLDAPGGPREAIRVAITLWPGNSGGALADVHGRVVGIPHLVVGRGLALAVPSLAVQRFLVEEPASRGYLGVVGRWVLLPEAWVRELGLPSRLGLLLQAVAEGSAAEQAGLGLGDVLVGVRYPGGGEDGLIEPVSGLGSLRIGASVRLAALRGGRLHWFEVRPARRWVS